ncbi:ABC transporter ATP-binding protein [Maritimibacter dapengensis]|uniref:Dipeptide ABC transporter ATP-binding protein n=1 Tax=Maritimibacter dapengensis TaxID=2836868 RepID=A0ABS6T6G0_9RHOB|nr:dipeptide ABC transporter ATP-binding protein [Maritimibacter dapengensis]MBV7380729.1 dipeptide ABC transporter ATP-binding protein [Maritimibacter dapengensis]
MIGLESLSLSIHGTPILRDIDLSIAPGKVTGLVGESGSGKSMTALAIMGLLPNGSDVSGAVRLGDENLLNVSERRLCDIRGNRIGMIFQEPMTALNPVKTIGDQVAETLLIHGRAERREARRIAGEKLARVGLGHMPLTRFPHELSGGQRQRVAIAMAIALHPELLIADEPTTALDVTTQAQILDLLNEIVDEEGMSLLLITHDLAVVAGMADHVAVMKEGEIVEQDATEPLFRNMNHPYTKALFAASSHQPDRKPLPVTDAILTADAVVRDYPTARPSLFAPPGRFRAVNEVSFTLGKGESLGLVGESGCGKSTLTRAILGLDPIQGGRITAFEREVGPDFPNALRAGIQVVFQDPYGSFNPRWTVERLVSEPFHLMPSPPKDRRARVAEALTDVGIDPSAMDRYIHEFSGGQRQRIAIARALITKPDLIVLDEAVSALDVSVRAQVLDLIARLQAEHGLSYIFISHDLSVVRSITDRVMVMRAGEIVEEGVTETVFTDPQHDYTRTLIAATPRIPDDWQEDGQHA